MRPQFDYLPSVELLRLLAQGNNLKQHLPKAVRLWVILRSLYGTDTDEVKLTLGENFTYQEWRNQFFNQTVKLNPKDKTEEVYHKRDEIPPLHDADCWCAKTLQYWIFDSGLCIPKDEWQKSFLQVYPMEVDELEIFLCSGNLPKKQKNSKKQQKNSPSAITPSKRQENYAPPFPAGRLFAVTGRNLEDHDFQTLIELDWLEPQKSEDGSIVKHQYCKIQKFPDINIFQLNMDTGNFITQADLTAISDTYSQPINGIQRFLMQIEYVVSQDGIDRIGEWKDELKKFWEKTPVPPISIMYDSASLGIEGKRIVYPVCLYYFQRAPYLCAFGQKPKKKTEIGWHNYRLDRIQEIIELDWENLTIPALLRQHCQKQPLLPEYIQQKMAEAWGFDFYQDSQLMLLRFEREFHDSYIQDSFRHETFKQIKSPQDFPKLMREFDRIPEAKKRLKEISQIFPDDQYAYYHTKYRVNDNNVIMRLRAWGQNVEVLLPFELRDRMAEDIEKTCQLYQNKVSHG